MSKSISLLSALICTFIWGTTFIAQDTGMELIGPYVFNGIRFFVGLLALVPFFLIFESKNWSIWPSVVICVVGGYFLTDFYDSTVRLGDLLVIIGALFWSLHIIFIGKIVQKFDIPIFVGIIQTFIVSFFSIILLNFSALSFGL